MHNFFLLFIIKQHSILKIYFSCPFTNWWTFGLFLSFCDYESFYYEYPYVSLWADIFSSFLLFMYLWVKYLGCMGVLRLPFWELAKLLSNIAAQFSHSTGIYKCSCFFTALSTLVIVYVSITAILEGMKWYLLVVLICICLMTNDVEYYLIC